MQSEQDIKKAYREQAMNWRPDRNKSSNTYEMFIQITEAYEILSNSEKRTQYDNLFFAEESVTVTTEFTTWQSQAKSKAQEYANMDFEKFQQRIFGEIKIAAKHSGGLGCMVLLVAAGLLCFIPIFDALEDREIGKAGLGLISVAVYGLFARWAYRAFVPSYQEDRKKLNNE